MKKFLIPKGEIGKRGSMCQYLALCQSNLKPCDIKLKDENDIRGIGCELSIVGEITFNGTYVFTPVAQPHHMCPKILHKIAREMEKENE